MNKIGKSLAAFVLAAVPVAVNAKVGTMNIDSYNLSVGEIKNIPVMVSENIASADGDIVVNDNECLEVIEVSSSFGNGNYFADIDLEGKALGQVASIKVKALKECKTNITIKNASIGSFEANAEENGLTFVSGDITVTAPVVEKEETVATVEEVKENKEVEKVVETKTETVEEVKEEIPVKKETKKESIATKIINLLKEILKLFER